MAEKKNALAELAENLEHDNFFRVDHYKQGLWLGKVQRIVAELAWACDNGNEGRPWMDVAQQTIMRCREIAEEGMDNASKYNR